MAYLNFIIFIVFIILTTSGDELNEEIVFPANSVDQHLLTDKPEENIDIFRKCEEGLGCIETDQTWYHKDYRPINLRPLDRNILKTDFLLIQNPKEDKEKLLYTSFQPKEDALKRSGFNNESELMILIHDFSGNGYTGWIKHLSYKIISNSMDYNLISIDWQRGAEPPYDQAIANARFVALEIISFVKELKEKMEYSLDNIHIIGHGVGAHIAGYVGATYNKIKKITGLDPSGPRFQGMPYNVKLNPRCAKYVEVIHTDSSQTRSQGINETLGHSDFYVNGGQKQPGCWENSTFGDLVSLKRGILGEGNIFPGCSHKRAFKYFIESIGNRNCSFQGIKCNNLHDFNIGKCTTCNLPNHDCRLFGLKTYLETSENNQFFLNTASQFPFCMLEYKITIYIKDEEKYGFFNYIMIDEEANVAEAYLSADKENNYRFLKGGNGNGEKGNDFIYFANPPKLHNIREVKAKWNEKRKMYCVIYCKQSIVVEKLSIKFLGTGQNDGSEEIYFCPNTKFLEMESESYVTFKPCNDSLKSQIFYNKQTTTTTSNTEKIVKPNLSLVRNEINNQNLVANENKPEYNKIKTNSTRTKFSPMKNIFQLKKSYKNDAEGERSNRIEIHKTEVYI